jgi:hypothetical protein
MIEALDQKINERVSFLKEQINPKNKALVNKTFEVQIHTLRNADPEKIAILILQKKKQLENARDTDTIEHLHRAGCTRMAAKTDPQALCMSVWQEDSTGTHSLASLSKEQSLLRVIHWGKSAFPIIPILHCICNPVSRSFALFRVAGLLFLH